MVPPLDDEAHVREVVGRVDGLILSGGDGRHRRGGAPPVPLSESDPERYRAEARLIEMSLSRSIPLLGICRGMQTLNQALGGTTHLSLSGVTPLSHMQEKSPAEGTHQILVKPSSRLFSLLGAERLEVNSLHTQAADEVAPSLEVVARSPDGIAEAVEWRVEGSTRFVVGVQYHPECLGAEHSALFAALVDAARERGDRGGPGP